MQRFLVLAFVLFVLFLAPQSFAVQQNSINGPSEFLDPPGEDIIERLRGDYRNGITRGYPSEDAYVDATLCFNDAEVKNRKWLSDGGWKKLSPHASKGPLTIDGKQEFTVAKGGNVLASVRQWHRTAHCVVRNMYYEDSYVEVFMGMHPGITETFVVKTTTVYALPPVHNFRLAQTLIRAPRTIAAERQSMQTALSETKALLAGTRESLAVLRSHSAEASAENVKLREHNSSLRTQIGQLQSQATKFVTQITDLGETITSLEVRLASSPQSGVLPWLWVILGLVLTLLVLLFSWRRGRTRNARLREEFDLKQNDLVAQNAQLREESSRWESDHASEKRQLETELDNAKKNLAANNRQHNKTRKELLGLLERSIEPEPRAENRPRMHRFPVPKDLQDVGYPDELAFPIVVQDAGHGRKVSEIYVRIPGLMQSVRVSNITRQLNKPHVRKEILTKLASKNLSARMEYAEVGVV
jgi:hypothetical protein